MENLVCELYKMNEYLTENWSVGSKEHITEGDRLVASAILLLVKETREAGVKTKREMMLLNSIVMDLGRHT